MVKIRRLSISKKNIHQLCKQQNIQRSLIGLFKRLQFYCFIVTYQADVILVSKYCSLSLTKLYINVCIYLKRSSSGDKFIRSSSVSSLSSSSKAARSAKRFQNTKCHCRLQISRSMLFHELNRSVTELTPEDLRRFLGWH